MTQDADRDLVLDALARALDELASLGTALAHAVHTQAGPCPRGCRLDLDWIRARARGVLEAIDVLERRLASQERPPDPRNPREDGFLGEGE
jgi:hypothetical protein